MLESYHAKLATPFAVLGIRTIGDRVSDIDYLPVGVAALAPLNTLAERACRELERYLRDADYAPKIPFEYSGTPFQCRVWREISAIPAGRTLSYNDIARALRTAPRPVGGACGRNRVPIVIPCHRVIGASGLGGFMGGELEPSLAIKRWLLRHEGVLGEHIPPGG
ncbi:MAG TPA: methylated-DNA--[protein]-cysteine S-methyltransferase [Burkholderiales bacterium]|nr:methylated-DNA--[protein]-cysteine S-methyltransferase [Burkholderiales bacterium]